MQEITADAPETFRARYKIVRLNSGADVPGRILSANADSGLCLMRVRIGGEEIEVRHDFGPGGLRIIPARR